MFVCLLCVCVCVWMIDPLPHFLLFFPLFFCVCVCARVLIGVHRALWDLSTSLFSQISVIPCLTYTRLVAKPTMFSSRAKQNISILYTHTYQFMLKTCLLDDWVIYIYICIYKNLIKSILYNLREFLFFTKLCSYSLN